jgi:hypothetical protein
VYNVDMGVQLGLKAKAHQWIDEYDRLEKAFINETKTRAQDESAAHAKARRDHDAHLSAQTLSDPEANQVEVPLGTGVRKLFPVVEGTIARWHHRYTHEKEWDHGEVISVARRPGQPVSKATYTVRFSKYGHEEKWNHDDLVELITEVSAVFHGEY